MFVMPRVFILFYLVEVVVDVDLKKQPASGRLSDGRLMALALGRAAVRLQAPTVACSPAYLFFSVSLLLHIAQFRHY